MKKLITLFVFVTAFTAVSYGYSHRVELYCGYWEEFNDLWVTNVNATEVFFSLQAEGDLESGTYTHAGITIYGSSTKYLYKKIYTVTSGDKTYNGSYTTTAGVNIKKIKLQCSGEGAWHDGRLITLNTSVIASW